MKRLYVVLLRLLVVIIIAVIINFYLTHRTRYLNYNYENYTRHSVAYMGVDIGTKLKTNPDQARSSEDYDEYRYPSLTYYNQTIINDKQVIKKIMNYINSIPLVSSTEKEAVSNMDESRSTTLRFYDESSTQFGWIIIYSEEYIRRSLDGKVFKVRDKGTQIVSGLENLDFDSN